MVTLNRFHSQHRPCIPCRGGKDCQEGDQVTNRANGQEVSLERLPWPVSFGGDTTPLHMSSVALCTLCLGNCYVAHN